MVSNPSLHSHFSFAGRLWFQFKACGFRLLRLWKNLRHQHRPCRWQAQLKMPDDVMLSESMSSLWDHKAPHAEQVLQAGKVQNLRIAARTLDGVVVPSGKVFSFWSQLGFPGRWKGYVVGRELRQGCLVPARAGGLCQLSNAIYDAALTAGFQIVERHRHSQIIPGSLAERDRDATVFWNYVDLRLTAEKQFQLRIAMDSEQLIVQIWGQP